MTFTLDGEFLVGSGDHEVRVWRVKDGKQVASMPVGFAGVECVAASSDGRWIAAGTSFGEILVWDARAYKQVFAVRIESIYDLDFCPDSARLVSADGIVNTATIWNIAARRKVRTLSHDSGVKGAKYSPQGERIATATNKSVRIWDSNDGRLLVRIKVEVRGTRGLVWCNNHLFVLAEGHTIKQFDAATGSIVSEWSIPDQVDSSSWIAMPQHGKFIAHSARKNITFWNTSAHIQLSPIQHTCYMRSIVCSSDGQLLAIAGEGKIILKHLFPSVSKRLVIPRLSRVQEQADKLVDIQPNNRTMVRFVSCLQSILTTFRFHLTLQEPELDIDNAALDAWTRGQLVDAEVLLSAAIPASENKAHTLASRALVRARLGRWDVAFLDAKEVLIAPLSHTWALTPLKTKSLEIQGSVIGYIAKCVALVGKGEKDEGIRVCDIAFQHFHSKHVTLLLLLKVRDFTQPSSFSTSSLFRLLSFSWPGSMSMRYHA